jgi:tetratricopeptide (TPR) repeat protein
MAGLSIVIMLIATYFGAWGADDVGLEIKAGNYEEALKILERVHEANQQREGLSYDDEKIRLVEEIYQKGLREAQKAELLYGDEREKAFRSALDYLVAAQAGFKLAVYNQPKAPYRRFALFRIGDSLRVQLPILKALKYEGLYESALQDAISSYGKAMESYPDSAETEFAAFWIGMKLYMRGEVQKAIGYYEMVKERFGPENGSEVRTPFKLADDSYYMLGRCFIDLGDIRKARDILESFLKVKDFSDTVFMPSAAIVIGDSYEPRWENLPKRINAYDRVLKAIKREREEQYKLEAVTSMLRLGEIYLELGMPEEAIKYLKPCSEKAKAYAYFPLFLESTIKLARSYIETNEDRHLREAIKVLEEGLELAENDRRHQTMIYSLLGRTYYELGEYRSAKSAYKSALDLGFLSYDDGYRLAKSYFEIGDYDRAFDVSRRYIEKIKDPSKVSPSVRTSLLKLYILVGDILFEEGDYTRAITAYELGAQDSFKDYALERIEECRNRIAKGGTYDTQASRSASP